MSDRTPEGITAAMRAELKDAMRARDQRAVAALRTALAAIANAEAPPVEGTPAPVHGRLLEHPRLVLRTADVDAILRREVAEREAAIENIAPHGRHAEVSALRAEIDVLRRHLG